jgi:hypothetical protein
MNGALRSDRTIRRRLCAETFDPFGDGLCRGVELPRGGGLPHPALDHAPHTVARPFAVSGAFSWVSILFSPRNLKLQQPQLPRAGSNGQPPESSHLAALITCLRRLGAHRLLRRRGLALLLPLCILR